MKQKLIVLIIALICGVAIFPLAVMAQEGQLIPFQGSLYENGTAVNATVNITFTIDNPSWTETHDNVAVVQGLYSVVLGQDTAFPTEMFTTGTPPQLIVNIGGSDIATVALHAPFISKEIIKMHMPDHIVVNPDNKIRGEFNYFEPNDAGSLLLYGGNDSLNVIVGSTGGGYSGFIGVYDSLRNQGATMWTNNYGQGQFYARNTEHRVSGWFGNINNNGFMQLVDWNDVGDDSDGAILAGFFGGKPELYMELGNGDHKVDLSIENNAGNFWMRGENSQNIEMGTKHWENVNGTDLPYFKMVGSVEVGDSINGLYRPDMIWMDVYHDENDNSESGGISFKSTDGSEFGMNAHGFSGAIRDFDVSNNINLGGNSNWNANQLNFSGGVDSTQSQLGYGGASIGRQFWNQNAYLGYVHVNGRDGNNFRSVVSLEARSEDGLTDWGVIDVIGGSSPNIEMGAKIWEGSNGSNLPFFKMMGSIQQGDTLNGFYHPDLVFMETQEDSNNNSEWGALTLRGTDGSEFRITSHGMDGGSNIIRNNEGKIRGEYNYYEPNDAGSLLLYGRNDSLNVLIGSRGTGGGHSGFIGVYDSLRNQGATMWTSNSGQGQFYARNTSHNVSGWFGNYSDAGFMQLVDYNDIGDVSTGAILAGFWAGKPELYLELEDGVHLADLSIENQMGKFWLKDTLGSSLNLSGDGVITLNGGDGSEFSISSHGFQGGQSATVEDSAGVVKGALTYDKNADAGLFELYGTNDSLNVSMGGTYSGYINVYDSLNNRGAQMWTNRAGVGQFYARNSTHNVSGWFGNTGDNGFIQLVDWNDAGDDSDGAILAGFWAGKPELYLELGNGAHLADLSIENHAGKFWLKDTLGASTRLGGEGNVAVWADNGGGEDEYALMNYKTGGAGGAVYGNVYLKSDLGGSLDLSGEGNISASGDVSAATLSATGDIDAVNFTASGNIDGGKAKLRSDWGTNGQGALQLMDSSNVSRMDLAVYDNGSGHYYSGQFLGNSTDGKRVNLDGDGNISVNNGTDDVISMNSDGHITAVAVFATTLQSSDGLVQTSDKRFKKNVNSIDDALAKTEQLNGYTYNWNKLAKKQKGITSQEEQVGVLAQELEEVFPQLVKTDKDGYKAVNYAALTAVLIEAIKELSEEVNTLKGENVALKAEVSKVDALTAKIDFIEKLLLGKAGIDGEKTAAK
jgi:hypothetical protein